MPEVTPVLETIPVETNPILIVQEFLKNNQESINKLKEKIPEFNSILQQIVVGNPPLTAEALNSFLKLNEESETNTESLVIINQMLGEIFSKERINKKNLYTGNVGRSFHPTSTTNELAKLRDSNIEAYNAFRDICQVSTSIRFEYLIESFNPDKPNTAELRTEDITGIEGDLHVAMRNRLLTAEEQERLLTKLRSYYNANSIRIKVKGLETRSLNHIEFSDANVVKSLKSLFKKVGDQYQDQESLNILLTAFNLKNERVLDEDQKSIEINRELAGISDIQFLDLALRKDLLTVISSLLKKPYVTNIDLDDISKVFEAYSEIHTSGKYSKYSTYTVKAFEDLEELLRKVILSKPRSV